MEPSGAIKGWIFVYAISVPLMRPNVVPTARPTSTATHAGMGGICTRPGMISVEYVSFCTSEAEKTDDTAMTEPSERSMPREMMQNATPSARRPRLDSDVRIFTKFRPVRNAGSTMPKMPISTASMANMAYLLRNAFTVNCRPRAALDSIKRTSYL